MARDSTDATPIESRDELVAWFEKGSKPRERWRIGTEHDTVGADEIDPLAQRLRLVRERIEVEPPEHRHRR